MTTHRVKPATATPVLTDPAYAEQAAIDITTDSQPTPENTTMQDALNAASPDTTTERSIMFQSDAIKKQLAFFARKFPGMIATRIQRLATTKFMPTPEADAADHFAKFGTYPEGSRLQCRHELMSLAGQLAWTLDASGTENTDNIIESAVAEWCGGGFQGKPKEEAVAGWVALGLTQEEALDRIKDAQLNTKNFLTIRRERLLEAMTLQVNNILAKIAPIEPDTDTLKAQCQKAFESAAMFSNTTEMLCIKADFSDWFGCAPTMPTLDKAMQDRANRIRAVLANKIDERAQAEARKLASFDPLADENDADMAA